MDRAEKEKSILDIETFYSFLNILKIVSDTDNFRSWLKHTHHIENDDHIFIGYQFFIDVIISHLVHSFERHSSFGIESDYTLYRASFVGVKIDDIPITCENVKLLKNLWNHYRSIRYCNDWNNIKTQLKEKNSVVFPIFDKIFSDSISSKTDKLKESVIWEKSLFWTFIYLNDTRQGRPFTYPGTILDSFVNQKNYNKIFVGYVYTLQYLWSRLLTEKDFAESSASKLHQAIKKIKSNKGATDKIRDFFTDNLSSSERDVRNQWQELDKFFTRLNNEIIKKRFPKAFPESDIQLSDQFDKASLDPLMHLSKIYDPDYLIKHKSFNSLTKLLDSFFFWHDMDALDTNKVHVFNGAFAFISLIIGEVEKYKMSNVTEPIWIARIKHPLHNGQNDISYGILLQSGGWISDSSGWLLFLDCGNDYSGSGGHQHKQVEQFVTKFQNEGRITVKEISVPSDIFVRYLRQKNIPSLVQQIKVVTTEIIEHSDIDIKSITPQSIVFQNIQQFNDNNVEEISGQIEKIVFFLRIFIQNDPKNISIKEKIDKISLTDDIAKKLEIIVLVLPLLPYIIENKRMESIESKLDDLKIKISQGPSSKIVISTGIDLFGTGIKHELEIPISAISYDGIYDDLKQFSDKPDNSLKNSPRLKTQIINFFQRKS